MRIKHLLIACALGSLIIVSPSIASVVSTTINPPNLQNGLLVHYTFDGKDLIQNVVDSSGQGDTGYLYGYTSTTTASGVEGQSLTYTNPTAGSTVKQGVHFNSVSNISLSSATTERTVTAWIRVANSVKNAAIFTMRNGTESASVFDFVIGNNGASNSNTGKLSFIIRGVGEATPYAVSGTNALNDGNWHFVAITRNSSKLDQLYVDGAADTSVTDGVTHAVNGDTTHVSVGGQDALNTAIPTFNGNIDDFRIYNRALSTAEMKQLYQSGQSLHPNTTINPPNLDNGLVVHYTFDGKDMIQNVADSSGNGYNGNLVGYTSTTTLAGPLGQALSFNGSTERVNVPTTWDDNGIPAYTISGWINIPDYTKYNAIFSNYQSSTNNFVEFRIDGTTGKPTVLVGNSGTAFIYATDNSAISLKAWHHVVGTWSGGSSNTTLSIYVDGVLQSVTRSSTGSFNGTYTPSATQTDIGRLGLATPSFSDGSIDDVRVWNRALSAAEVQQLYQSGQSFHLNTSVTPPNLTNGLTAWFSMDGNDLYSGATDLSGHGNNATLFNFTSPTTTQAGAIGQALTFNGTSQYITLPSAVQPSAQSFCYWLSKRTIDATTRTFQFSLHPTASTLWVFGIWQSGGNLQFRLYDNTGSNYIGRTATAALATSNKWYQVCMTWDGTLAASGIKIYVNGARKDDTDANAGTYGTPSSSSLQLEFGADKEDSLYWDGGMDDIRVWNRALSAAEVRQLYDAGR